MSTLLFPRIAWHSLALYTSIWGFRQLDFLEQLTGQDLSKEYGGHYQFLTICSLVATIVTMGVALLQDALELFTGWSRDSGSLTASGISLIKTMLLAASMPTETLVSMLFWTLFAIDPTLLIPPVERDDPANPGQTMQVPVSVPLEIDLTLHAAPAVFLLVDFLFFSPPFSRQIRPELISATITAAYCAWVEHCAAHNGGRFPYPVLNLISSSQRYGLYALCAIIFIGILRTAQVAHRLLDERVLGGRWKDQLAGQTEIELAQAKLVGKGAKRV